jgi:hypothetical protein
MGPEGVPGQKVTKQLISSKKSRFITGAYFNYATSPQMNRMVRSIWLKKINIYR